MTTYQATETWHRSTAIHSNLQRACFWAVSAVALFTFDHGPGWATAAAIACASAGLARASDALDAFLEGRQA